MLLNFLRYFRGYVLFSVSGRYPERFINITARNGVRLWNVKRQNEGFTACMYRADYRRIRPLARGAGVVLRIKGKRGIPDLMFRYRDRVGAAVGVCAFLLTVFVMSQFIWCIDITGLDTISRSEMISLMREEGLYVGAFKPSLDYNGIARAMMLDKHEIGWMAVNVTGSYASVEIKEESPAPDVADVTTPCNIKASSDGLILRIEAAEGEAAVTEGSGVIEGQLLVSGVRGSEETGYRLVHADARVIAQTQRQAAFSTSSVVASLRPTGETAERKTASVFGLRIPYRFDGVSTPYAVSRTVTLSPSPLDITLPIGTVTESVSALEKKEQTLDDKTAEAFLKRQSDLYEVFSLSDCTVKHRDQRLVKDGGHYTLTVSYTCEEDIACPEPIGTDENTQ